MFTINLEDGREAPSKARKKGAKRLEFLVVYTPVYWTPCIVYTRVCWTPCIVYTPFYWTPCLVYTPVYWTHCIV